MASTPSSSLPVSNPQSSAVAASQLATPALRSFISRLSSSLHQSFAQRRPWYELVDRSAFSRPESLSEATSHIRKNLSYFSLLSHPFSLIIIMCLLGAWLFLYLFRPSDQPLVLFGRTFLDRETLLILIVFTIIVVFLTNIGSLMISALLVGLSIVCAHGAFRVPEDLFLDDQEQTNAGLLSFLSGGDTSSTATAPAVVALI